MELREVGDLGEDRPVRRTTRNAESSLEEQRQGEGEGLSAEWELPRTQRIALRGEGVNPRIWIPGKPLLLSGSQFPNL